MKLNRDQIMGMLGFISMFLGGRKKVMGVVNQLVDAFDAIDEVKAIREKVAAARALAQDVTLNAADVAMLDKMFTYTDIAAKSIHDKLNNK